MTAPGFRQVIVHIVMMEVIVKKTFKVGSITQWLEYQIFNLGVLGSSPSRPKAQFSPNSVTV